MEKKIIKFGGVRENSEVEVENEIIIPKFSTNYGFELKNGMLVTTIDGREYKMCYIGSSTLYLKYEIKPYLRDDVTFKLFKETKELVGKNWRTNAAVLTLIENVQYTFMLEKGIEIRYGYTDIKDDKKSLIGLIPIDYEYNEIVDSFWNDFTGEYEISTTREAKPIEKVTA